jgi:hypothetical protein
VTSYFNWIPQTAPARFPVKSPTIFSKFSPSARTYEKINPFFSEQGVPFLWNRIEIKLHWGKKRAAQFALDFQD